MRVALLSDVHGNRDALDAVLAEVAAQPGVGATWVLGDSVGYGPDPSGVIVLLQEREALVIAGNHDRAVATGDGLDLFHPIARAAALLHREWLSPGERDWLAALPEVGRAEGVTLVHGSLRSPMWEYVWDTRVAYASLERAETDLSCNGHTHVPAVFSLRDDQVSSALGRGVVRLEGRSLVNPGSVGQPRDRDPRASWAILDVTARTVEFRRTAYDVRAVQDRMRARGLPALLADRLASGT